MTRVASTLAILAVFAILAVGSGGKSEEETKKESVGLVAAAPENVDLAALAETFKIGGTATDLQRDAKEKEIKGKIVNWAGLKVYEVAAKGKCFRVQTSATDAAPGVFADACPPEGGSSAMFMALKTGSLISIKGKITGTSMRYIELEPAIISQ